MKKKILFIVHHRVDRSPGQRFRFEQYIKFLEDSGFECHFSNFLDERSDKIFYAQGKLLAKAKVFAKCIAIRLRDCVNANKFDIIFIFREAFMTGNIWFEKAFHHSRAKVVFDFDDAIWLPQVSKNFAPNKKLSFLKRPNKTADIIKISDLIIAGNSFLKEYAYQFNKNVVIIPTTIDTKWHLPAKLNPFSNKTIIGWTGSKTTIDHFDSLLPILVELSKKYSDILEIHIIGDSSYTTNLLSNYVVKPWRFDREIADLNIFDIGIMPLPNDKWSKGKCGLKGLQYMALEIPTVMSPVGVNTEIITHGKNGFLADTKEDWIKYLSLLIEDKDLRIKLGKEGRKTIKERYSVEANKQKYLQAFQGLVG